MKFLITASTPDELLAAKQVMAIHSNIEYVNLVTGIGMAATVYHTLKCLQNEKFDCVLNIGIAGSYNPNFAIGDVCWVTKEYFGDSGVRTLSGFSTLFDENILNANTFPFVNGALHAPTSLDCFPARIDFPMATGLTVQTVSGEQQQIEERYARYAPDIETMEGAAFFYICLQERLPFVALRAISNSVEPRDKSAWDIPLALNNLSIACRRLMSGLLNY
ncbi:MAG: futalosine hydrolase [Prevotellaceae bacterium]|jgi:futalosine hydrolase|nr:futalosine hydrolase [Prevotellaceae bacterium]